MKEVTGNLWEYKADVRVITTNGTVKKNGECVMGRGCALEAKQKYPGIAFKLGCIINAKGNIPSFLWDGDNCEIYSFPVKHNWNERADIKLIEVSAKIFKAFSDLHSWKTIVLPRPGCGNGGLKWEDVKPVLEPILDDRFHVITFR